MKTAVELKRLQDHMRYQLRVQKREQALQDHAMRQLQHDNLRLRVAVAVLRHQAKPKE
jgi:hypothetical protein